MQDTLFEGAQFKPETISEDFIINDINNTPTPEPTPAPQNFNPDSPQQMQPQPQGVNVGNFINEEMAVEIFDGLMSTLAVIGTKALKLNATKRDLKASAAEKKMLEEPMKQVLQSSNIVISNPYEAFAFAAVAVYGGKILGLYITQKIGGSDDAEEITDLNKLANRPKKKDGRGRPRKNPIV